MLSVSKVVVVAGPTGRASRMFPNAPGPLMEDLDKVAANERFEPPDAAAIREVEKLSGAELGMAVAREVMRWRSDHEQFADCWVDTDGKLTGYYYGRPFSPYRDRNALAEVWKRLEALHLRTRYMRCVELLLQAPSGDHHVIDAWALHTCGPEVACRAALLAVRMAR